MDTVETKNSLLGKEYYFTSSRFKWAYEIIRSKITVKEDRLLFKCETKRFNVAPAILYKDITGITITNVMAPIYVWLAIACFIGGFASIVTFFGVPVAIWLGLNKKITIYQRSGVNVQIIEKSKEQAEMFKKEMESIINI